jgi:hypothetical protein
LHVPAGITGFPPVILNGLKMSAAPPGFSFALVHRVVLAMIDKDGEKTARPRSSTRRLLPQLRSEFEQLCDELGGPADGIDPSVKLSAFPPYCKDYPSGQIVPLLRKHQSDEGLARRHWPWAAYAIGQHDFETKERKKYSDEPTPDAVAEILLRIKGSARNLIGDLGRLQTLSYRLKDPTAPFRRGHLGWLDAIVSQAAAGVPSNDINEDGAHQLAVDLDKQVFVERLAMVEAAAKFAAKHLDRKLLDRERGQSNPALRTFVFRCGQIWTSLTGRKPSAQRVHRDGGEDPDFVIFVRQLARIASAPEPTRSQVVTCLRNLTLSTMSKNSL